MKDDDSAFQMIGLVVVCVALVCAMILVAMAIMLLSNAARAHEPLPVPKAGSCPSGYMQSGGYCTPMSGTKKPAFPKVGSCPSGYYQSGNYCLGM